MCITRHILAVAFYGESVFQGRVDVSWRDIRFMAESIPGQSGSFMARI